MRYIPRSFGCGLDELHELDMLKVPLRTCGGGGYYGNDKFKDKYHDEYERPRSCGSGELKHQTMVLFLLFIMVLNIVLLLLVLFKLLK